jgi:hypothetical protein
MQED